MNVNNSNSNNSTNNTKSRIKKRKLNFTQIANSFLRDKRISFKAKGLFSYMFSHDESWNFTLNSISKQQEEGIESIRTAMNELKAYGYIVYKKHSNGTGIYYLDDEPHLKEETINNIEDKEQNEMRNNRHNKKQTPRYLEKKEDTNIKRDLSLKELQDIAYKKAKNISENLDLNNEENEKIYNQTNLHPQDIIKTYKELISSKYEDINQTTSLKQIILYSEDLEKMLKGIENYSKHLKLKQKKPEKLFFFIKDKIYLDYQNEQVVELNKNETIVPKDLIGLKFRANGEEIEFLEDGYYKIEKDWKVTNAKNVSDMVELVRNFLNKNSNLNQGDNKCEF